jgi:glucan-binding YG repeat protein
MEVMIAMQQLVWNKGYSGEFIADIEELRLALVSSTTPDVSKENSNYAAIATVVRNVPIKYKEQLTRANAAEAFITTCNAIIKQMTTRMKITKEDTKGYAPSTNPKDKESKERYEQKAYQKTQYAQRQPFKSNVTDKYPLQARATDQPNHSQNNKMEHKASNGAVCYKCNTKGHYVLNCNKRPFCQTATDCKIPGHTFAIVARDNTIKQPGG